MGAAFKAFFTALTTLFTAFNRLASAINHLCAWSDETAGSFYDEAKADREAKAKAKEQELLASPVPTLAAPTKVRAITNSKKTTEAVAA